MHKTMLAAFSGSVLLLASALAATYPQDWAGLRAEMVERTIGVKPGTGGTRGVEYLRETLFRPLFPDLWTIRSSL